MLIFDVIREYRRRNWIKSFKSSSLNLYKERLVSVAAAERFAPALLLSNHLKGQHLTKSQGKGMSGIYVSKGTKKSICHKPTGFVERRFN